MKQTRLVLLCLLALIGSGIGSLCAQTQDMMVRCVAFYNLENLFDTIHDEGKNDYEYLPDGGMKWTPLKYEHKIQTVSYTHLTLPTN